MIDIHCHILPGIDDGAASFEKTIDMLKIASEDGIDIIIATPHYCEGVFENRISAVKEFVLKINEELKGYGSDISILPGQEVFLNRRTVELYNNGYIGGLNDSRYMLVELPFDAMPDYALEMLYELRILGIVPVLAHPERYEFIIKKPILINDFIEEGCLFQINSQSINGLFGKSVQATSELLLRNGICDFIASDAHTTGGRSPVIKKAIEYANGVLNKDLSINQNKLINNEKIESSSQKLKVNKGLFSFLKGK